MGNVRNLNMLESGEEVFGNHVGEESRRRGGSGD